MPLRRQVSTTVGPAGWWVAERGALLLQDTAQPPVYKCTVNPCGPTLSIVWGLSWVNMAVAGANSSTLGTGHSRATRVSHRARSEVAVGGAVALEVRSKDQTLTATLSRAVTSLSLQLHAL